MYGVMYQGTVTPKKLKLIFDRGEAIEIRAQWRRNKNSVHLIEIERLRTMHFVDSRSLYNEKNELAYFGILINV